MQRFNGNDSTNELYTCFRYNPINGLGYEKGVHRRYPSSIIEVGDFFYIWYAYCKDTKSSWLNADIWYAISKDGVNWEGKVVWDDYSVFTANILVAERKYYLT